MTDDQLGQAAPFYLSFIICHLSLVISSAPIALAEKLATNYTAQPSRNQIKKPITCTCTSTTTCTYFVDVDVHVLVDACCHLQICFQKVKVFGLVTRRTAKSLW